MENKITTHYPDPDLADAMADLAEQQSAAEQQATAQQSATAEQQSAAQQSATAEQQAAAECEALSEIEETTVEQSTLSKREEAELRAALTEARIKLALLVGGACRDKLQQAAQIANALVHDGADPETAAEVVLSECPQLRLTQREVPKFATASGGKGDGLAALRSIFAARR